MQSEETQQSLSALSGLQPIFVIGCCNSGTTLLWQTILEHPHVSGPKIEGQAIGELPWYLRHYLGKESFRLFALPQFRKAYYLTEGDASDLRSAEVINIYKKYFKPGTRFVEKSPANAIRMRFLQAVFPDAQFVIIKRHGMAVAEGIRRKRLSDPERPHLSGQQTKIEQAAEQWVYCNKIILHDLTYIQNFHVLRYEELVKNPQRVMDQVFDFLSLESLKIESGRFRVCDNTTQIKRLTKAEFDTTYSIQSQLLSQLNYSEKLTTTGAR